MTSQEEMILSFVMAYGDDHTDENGIRHFPSPNQLSAGIGFKNALYLLMDEDYLFIAADRGLAPKPKAEIWWAERKKRLPRVM